MKNFYRYLFVCLLVGLCACSDDKEEPTQPEQESPLSQSEIKILKSYQTDGIPRLFVTDIWEMKLLDTEIGKTMNPWGEEGILGLSSTDLGDFIILNGTSYIELDLHYSSMIYSDVTSVWSNYKKYKESKGETIPSIYYCHNNCINISQGDILVGDYNNLIKEVTDDSLTLYGVGGRYMYIRNFSVKEINGDIISNNIVTVESKKEGILYIIDKAIETFGDIMSSTQIPGSKDEFEIDLKALKEKYEK